jgi:succinate dehydrogenase/fumarate reductase flavoprotein subunit
MMSENTTKHEYDVIVIGAGGAGLRAAIEAARSGAKTAIITKSLLGKATRSWLKEAVLQPSKTQTHVTGGRFTSTTP